MNASIANLILSRIEVADFAFLDKYAGLTRAITDGRLDKPVTIPVSCTVNDPLACDSSTLADLLPDPKYRSVLFFEGDTVPRKIVKRAIGTSYESRLRLIVWLNCEKLGGACNCGDVPLMQLIDLLNKRIPDSSPFNRIVVSVEGGGPTRGSEVFGKYTLDNKATQFLHYPFDYFALDITVSFMLIPGCSPESIAEDVACWTPPSNPRRRYPKDFTCEELTNTETGLTATQLGSDCLDCGGSGPCDPTILNGVEIVGTAGTVLQGGVQVGSVDPATGIVTVDECPIAPECEDATVANSDASYSELIPSGDGLILDDNVIALRNTGGDLISTTNVPATNPANIVAPDAIAHVVNSNGDNAGAGVGSIQSIPSGKTTNVLVEDTDWELYNSIGGYINDGRGASGQPILITAPNGSVQPKDTGGTNIGAPISVVSGGTANAPIADSAVTVNGSAFASVKATQSLNVPVKQGGVAVGSKVGSEWIVPQEPTLFEMGYAADYLRFQITPKEAGIYTSWSSLGVSGTWTYRKGLTGAYAAPSGSVVLNAGDWIEVMRTINTADGVWTWVR